MGRLCVYTVGKRYVKHPAYAMITLKYEYWIIVELWACEWVPVGMNLYSALSLVTFNALNALVIGIQMGLLFRLKTERLREMSRYESLADGQMTV